MVQKEKTLETPAVDNEQSPSPVPAEACAEAPGPAEDSGLAVEPAGLRKFISGVVEGNRFFIQTLSMYFSEICRYARVLQM